VDWIQLVIISQSSANVVPLVGSHRNHLERNPTKSHPSAQKLYHKQVHPRVIDSPNLTVTLESRSPLLLGRCSRQLRKSCAGANMMYSRAERVFILEHYFASKSFAAVREAFRNAYSDKEVPNKTNTPTGNKISGHTTVCL
jgi:hypothetical protein